MANYDEMSRSNYVKVKDPEAWKAFCKRWGLEPIEEGGLWGYLAEEAPSTIPMDENGELLEDEAENSDIYLEMEQQLEKGEVLIAFFVGNEKMRYLTGSALAMSPGRKVIEISLESIYDLVKKRWKAEPTRAEY